MPIAFRLSPIAAALLLAGCGGAAPEANNSASNEADSGLPVKPGVYGNVTAAGGMELQLYGPPRDMLEITVCEGPCKEIGRAQYMVEGETLVFNYREKQADGQGKLHRYVLTQAGADVSVADTDPDAEPGTEAANEAGPAPVVLKRLPGRTALKAAQDAVLGRN